MEKLAGYQLGETIETGTHTITYRATHPDEPRGVLVKTLKPDLHASRELLDAIEHEGRLLARVDHPALATLLTRVHDDERPALVFLDHGGHRLDAVLAVTEAIEPLCTIAIAIALAGAISAIHRAGEVHGSLRPEVVELTDRGTVFLHGFGTHRPGAASIDTEALMLPEHLAPEQLLGEQADAQTDIFALGVLIYRMVAGRSPFGSGGSSVSQSIRHEDPPAMGSFARDVPDRLEKIVARCLKKRRRDRYADMASVQSDLGALFAAKTPLPREVLVSRALANAELGDALPIPRERAQELGILGGPSRLQRIGAPVAVALVALLLAAVVWRSFSASSGQGRGGDARGIVDRPAELRVLAEPWAEIHIDGKMVDVTPVGRPIQVSPGRHVILFKHPNAPDEKRSVEIIAGQTIVLDVQMQVVRPVVDAGAADASAEDESP